MEHIKQRLATIERGALLWVLSQAIHELTLRARFFYDQPEAVDRMQETNEAIHRVSAHLCDLTDAKEPFTPNRADSVAEAIKLLTPAALDRIYGSQP